MDNSKGTHGERVLIGILTLLVDLKRYLAGINPACMKIEMKVCFECVTMVPSGEYHLIPGFQDESLPREAFWFKNTLSLREQKEHKRRTGGKV